MTAAQEYTEHLLALRRAEVASHLEQQGYRIESKVQLDTELVDLMASKPGQRTVIYDFELPGSLHAKSERIQILRRAASHKGFGFKLVVVTPPKRVSVAVEGLEKVLFECFQERSDTTALGSLGSRVIVNEVTDVEITTANVHGGQTDVTGRGVVGVTLEYGGGDWRDGVTSFEMFPFLFDCTLDSQQQIIDMRELEVDTSSLNG